MFIGPVKHKYRMVKRYCHIYYRLTKEIILEFYIFQKSDLESISKITEFNLKSFPHFNLEQIWYWVVKKVKMF